MRQQRGGQINMLVLFETVNIIAILLMLSMLAVILRQQPSKAQTAFILYDICNIIFVIGIHLELMHSDTVGEALSGLCVQYVGQAAFLMALLWLASEFAHLSIPLWVYGLQALLNVLVLAGIFTAENHTYFYTHMEILTDGMYNRIEVGGGTLWLIDQTQAIQTMKQLREANEAKTQFLMKVKML
ncbi:MAG: histidine kinase N-terminal 7TM domain-containing protein [Lachnospiraceae bacterium]